MLKLKNGVDTQLITNAMKNKSALRFGRYGLRIIVVTFWDLVKEAYFLPG